MAKKTYLPTKEADRKTFLDHIDDALPGVLATKYGVTSAELERLHDFRLWHDWTFAVLDSIRAKSESYTAFRDDLSYGKSVPQGPLTPPQAVTPPAQPVKGAPPAAIIPVADGFGFVASLAARIKGHADYTKADGEVLGLEGPAIPAPDPITTKPEIKLVHITGGKVQLQWKKLGFTGVRIEVDRGNGTWTFLDMDTKPHYEDPASPAPGTTTLWKYRAISSRATNPSANGVIRGASPWWDNARRLSRTMTEGISTSQPH